MRIFFIIIMITFSTWNNITRAENIWFSSKISMLYPLSNGDAVVTFKDDSTSCTSGSKYHYLRIGQNGITIEGAKKIYSLFLTGASIDKKVSVNFDDSTDGCFINRAYIVY